jgi:hypothetical protein
MALGMATSVAGQVNVDMDDVVVLVASGGPTTGSFDIVISPAGSDTLDSFTFQVRPGDPALTLTGLTASATFAGATMTPQSTAVQIDWAGNVSSPGGTSFGSDTTAATVSFEVAEGELGTFPVLWGFDPSTDTSVASLDGNAQGFTSQRTGSVTVIPEPMSVSLLLIAAMGAMSRRMRR